MKLPTEKSIIDLTFIHQKIGIIGAPGIGKSAFLAQEPKALFIEAEAGLNFLEVFKVSVRCWEDLREVYSELKVLEQTNKFPYTLGVIDTVDRIVDFAEEEIVKKAKEFYKTMANEINTVGDIPNGAGWSKQKDLVMGFLNKLEELPWALAYIGHLQTKEIKEGVSKYNKDTINIGGKLGLELLAWPDHLLHIKSQLVGEKLKRRIRTKPSQSIEAKSRGGIVPDNWEWSEDMKGNYEYFRKLFK